MAALKGNKQCHEGPGSPCSALYIPYCQSSGMPPLGKAEYPWAVAHISLGHRFQEVAYSEATGKTYIST